MVAYQGEDSHRGQELLLFNTDIEERLLLDWSLALRTGKLQILHLAFTDCSLVNRNGRKSHQAGRANPTTAWE